MVSFKWNRNKVCLSIWILMCVCSPVCGFSLRESQQLTPKATDVDFLVISEYDYLIITTEEYLAELERLATWKTQKGLNVTTITISQIDNSYSSEPDLPAKIKACIADHYEAHNLSYVCLAGDHDDVPSRDVYAPEDYLWDGNYVSSDFYYADLDNDWDSDADGIWGEKDGDDYDFFPEVYVGRLSANNPTEMAHLVDNIVMYETSPPEGDWIDRTLYGGSFIMFDSDGDNDSVCDYPAIDYNRFNHFVAESLENLTDYQWDEYFLAESEGLSPSTYYYDTTLNEANLMDSINEGAAYGIIMGHGTPYRMVQFLFLDDYDGDGLMDYSGDVMNYTHSYMIEDYDQPDFIRTDSDFDPTANKLGFYVLEGCSVGTFNETEDCLTETFLKTNAIGCIGSSQVTWVEDGWTEREHGGWYLDGITFRFYEQLMNCSHPGKAFGLAKADYMMDKENPAYSLVNPPWNFPFRPEWEDKVLKQTNLFGDPEVYIWIDGFEDMIIQTTDSEAPTNKSYRIHDKMANPLVNATVTVSLGDQIIWRQLTDENGSVDLPYTETELEDYDFTIYLEGYLPYQKLTENLPPTDDDTTDDDTTDDDSPDDDNSDNDTDDDDQITISGGVFFYLLSTLSGVIWLMTTQRSHS